MESITPGQAMAESALRTIVKLAAGWIVAYLVAWGLKYGIHVDESFHDAVFNALWALGTIGVSALQRKFWPLSTDRAGVGRTDVTAGGKPL